MSVINPSVFYETTFPFNLEILCKHSPTTLLTNAVVRDAKIRFYKSVPVSLKDFPVKLSKLFLLDNPLTTFP